MWGSIAESSVFWRSSVKKTPAQISRSRRQKKNCGGATGEAGEGEGGKEEEECLESVGLVFQRRGVRERRCHRS
jgi:hypothetical protein